VPTNFKTAPLKLCGLFFVLIF